MEHTERPGTCGCGREHSPHGERPFGGRPMRHHGEGACHDEEQHGAKCGCGCEDAAHPREGCNCGCHVEKGRGAKCGCGCEDATHPREGCTCGCHEQGGHRGVCRCGGHHGRFHHFQRRFISRAERIAMLERYLETLRLEATAVEEHIADLKAKG